MHKEAYMHGYLEKNAITGMMTNMALSAMPSGTFSSIASSMMDPRRMISSMVPGGSLAYDMGNAITGGMKKVKNYAMSDQGGKMLENMGQGVLDSMSRAHTGKGPGAKSFGAASSQFNPQQWNNVGSYA